MVTNKEFISVPLDVKVERSGEQSVPYFCI